MTPSTLNPRPLWLRIWRKFVIFSIVTSSVLVIGGGIFLFFFLRHSYQYDAASKEKMAHGQYHSRIYSASYPFVEGAQIDMDGIVDRLESRGYELIEASAELKNPGEYHKKNNILEIFVRGFDLPGRFGPQGIVRLIFKNRVISTITILKGPIKTSYLLEPILLKEVLFLADTQDKIKPNSVRATYVPLSKIPKLIQNAIIASEDQRFFRHGGVDIWGTIRAVISAVKSTDVRQGGSTIEQQIARNLLLSNKDRTLARKYHEWAAALSIDRNASKEQILETYLNTVYFGETRRSINGQSGVTIRGIVEAARVYFNKTIDTLTLSEVAILTQIIQAPSLNSPLRSQLSTEQITKQRDRVIRLMEKLGSVSHEEAVAAYAEPIKIHPGRIPPEKYGFFTSYAENFLEKKLGANYRHQGLTIYTTMEPALQDDLEKNLPGDLHKIEQSVDQNVSQKGRPSLQGAAFLMDYTTGKVLAISGGTNFRNAQFNRAFQAHRQPGSTFKGISYAAAFENNPNFTPATAISDKCIERTNKEGKPWKVHNYEFIEYDTISVGKAFARSENCASIEVAIKYAGMENVAKMATTLGLDPVDPKDLAISIGSSETTLDKLTSAYATFANQGIRTPALPVEQIVDTKGATIYEFGMPTHQVIKKTTAELMTELMKSVVCCGTAWGLMKDLEYTPQQVENFYPFFSAGKTGTTNDERDGWYVGFVPNPHYLMGVWVGFDNDKKGQSFRLGLSAADTAVPIWGQRMSSIMKPYKKIPFVLPDDIHEQIIDGFSGGQTTKSCPAHVVFQVGMLKGTEPKQSCPLTPEQHPAKREHKQPAVPL